VAWHDVTPPTSIKLFLSGHYSDLRDQFKHSLRPFTSVAITYENTSSQEDAQAMGSR